MENLVTENQPTESGPKAFGLVAFIVIAVIVLAAIGSGGGSGGRKELVVQPATGGRDDLGGRFVFYGRIIPRGTR